MAIATLSPLHMKQNQSHPPQNTDPLLKVSELAAWFQVNEATIWRWVAESKFPKGMKLCRTTRWKKSDVEQWLNDCADKAEADFAHEAIETGFDI